MTTEKTGNYEWRAKIPYVISRLLESGGISWMKLKAIARLYQVAFKDGVPHVGWAFGHETQRLERWALKNSETHNLVLKPR